MKTLTKLALTGTLIFGLNGCGYYSNKDSNKEIFNGIVSRKEDLGYRMYVYEITNKKDTIYGVFPSEDSLLTVGDSVKILFKDGGVDYYPNGTEIDRTKQIRIHKNIDERDQSKRIPLKYLTKLTKNKQNENPL